MMFCVCLDDDEDIDPTMNHVYEGKLNVKIFEQFNNEKICIFSCYIICKYLGGVSRDTSHFSATAQFSFFPDFAAYTS